jgi:putative SOS response-associated peptidase YedK
MPGVILFFQSRLSGTHFYEWRELGGKKYPYYIFLKDKDIFSFAGIWKQ